MHKSDVLSAGAVHRPATPVWLLAEGVATMADNVSISLSRSECNLGWQQLPDKFGWVRKLYPRLQLPRRAGLAAPRWGSPPHPLLQPRAPLPP